MMAHYNIRTGRDYCCVGPKIPGNEKVSKMINVP
jgi:hypothetical protein